MAFLLGCEKVRVEFPTKTVFDGVSLGVDEGDRIGIVGRNGDGKSTLLNLLAGMLEPDEGRVLKNGAVRVGMLGQSDALDDAATVGESLVGDAPEYEWAGNPRVRDVIAGLARDIPWDAPVGTLSGGQRRRVDLARLLMGDWDVLALDEPTNHLDVRAITWLAAHLKGRWKQGTGALLVVTHDRWFLDEACTSMWEVHDRQVEPFEGGFSAYVMQRVERDRLAALAEQKRQNALRRELAWLSRGARARATKPKFHVAAAQALIADVPPLRDQLELKRMAMARLGKQVVELERVTVRFDGAANVAAADGAGNAASSAHASEGNAPDSAAEAGTTTTARETNNSSRTVLDGVDWIIGPGDRYGIVGENGAGKTTLLRVIQGLKKPTSGSVKIGKTVRFAVLSQHLDDLAQFGSDRVRQVIGRYGHRTMLDGKEVTPAQLLEKLGFSHNDLNEPVCDLSGGQKRRLALMLILLEESNVLVLDEPGNDLDTDMLAVVEDLLDSWPGTLLLVTHDRYLMERVTDNQFALIDGKVRHLPGGVDEYLQLMEEREAGAVGVGSRRTASGNSNAFARTKRPQDASAHAGGSPSTGAESSSPGASAANTHSRLSGGERRALRKLMQSNERKIETLNAKMEAVRAEMAAADPADFVALGNFQSQIDDFQSQIAALEEEWMEAAETLGE